MLNQDEIYQKRAQEYDTFVSAEDYRRNLNRFLHQLVDWTGKLVIEAGVGTGRITRMYINEVEKAICCDHSRHMMKTAKANLADFIDKIIFIAADNLDLPKLDFECDIFIEGWSYCYSASSQIDMLIDNAKKNLRKEGKIILIESLGTNVEQPGIGNQDTAKLYELLDARFGFKKETIRTDYKFSSVEEAANRMGFFFGDKMRDAVRVRDSVIVPEFTGVWSLDL